MGTSIFTPGIGSIAHQFEQSVVVTTLGLSLYVLGFALGPIFFAPMSGMDFESLGVDLPVLISVLTSYLEERGRRAVQVPAWALFCVFQLGCVLARNIETLLICRFFVGVFGSPALTVAGGVQLDYWKRNTRTRASRRFVC
jgi:DHA1 family multidrug resistance protein-like MFS transporter